MSTVPENNSRQPFNFKFYLSIPIRLWNAFNPHPLNPYARLTRTNSKKNSPSLSTLCLNYHLRQSFPQIHKKQPYYPQHRAENEISYTIVRISFSKERVVQDLSR